MECFLRTEKDKMKNKKKFYYIGCFFALLGFYVLLQIKYINDEWFATDELDIMVIGKGIAQGQFLYKDAPSQHMPFSYYISAFFYKLGAVSVTEQRIAFYIFIAFFWTLIAFLYSDIMDKKILFLYPIIHCCMIQNYAMGTTILSEHLAGCGAIILLLEFLRFIKKRDLNIKSCIMISISIVLTFGTIFVAIYPVFFIGIGVLALELKWKRENKYKIKEWIVPFFKKYIKLIIIVSVPWLLLFGYYIVTDTFDDFILGAYKINREVYPKYNGGLGNNIFSAFLQPLDQLSSFFVNGFQFSTWNYALVLQWIFIICCLIFMVKFFKENGIGIGCITLMYIFSLGLRGIFNFHGTACVEVLSFMVSYILISYGYKSRGKFNRLKLSIQSVWIMIFVIILSGYFQNISHFASLNFSEKKTYQTDLIQAITDRDEAIWITTFDNIDSMLADRPVVGAEAATPWMWEGKGKKQFKHFKKSAPRVAIFVEEHECWGHKLTDYAPQVIKFIKKNYTLMPDTAYVYVRNDYYEEAFQKMNESKEE